MESVLTKIAKKREKRKERKRKEEKRKERQLKSRCHSRTQGTSWFLGKWIRVQGLVHRSGFGGFFQPHGLLSVSPSFSEVGWALSPGCRTHLQRL